MGSNGLPPVRIPPRSSPPAPPRGDRVERVERVASDEPTRSRDLWDAIALGAVGLAMQADALEQLEQQRDNQAEQL